MIKTITILLACWLVSTTSIAVIAEEKFLTGSKAVDAIRGSWGGRLNTEKREVASDLVLEEAYFDISSNPWRAKVRMIFFVSGANARVIAETQHANGKAGNGEVRFAATQWDRLIVSTGKKNTFTGNPLVLRILEDARLSFNYEGEGGFSGSLVRRTSNDRPAR